MASDCFCNFDGGNNPWTYGGPPGDSCCNDGCRKCTDKCRTRKGSKKRDSSKQDGSFLRFDEHEKYVPGTNRQRQISGENSRQGLISRALTATARKELNGTVGHLLGIRVLTDHNPSWQTYAPKGLQYYDNWSTKTGDDAPYPCNFDNFFDLSGGPTSVTTLSRYTVTLVSETGYRTDSSQHLSMMAIGPRVGRISQFTVTIGARPGVFIAAGFDRGGRAATATTPARDLIPYQFSDIAWWMWDKAVRTGSDTATDYSGIKSVFMRDIYNPETMAILNEVFEGEKLDSTLIFGPSDRSHGNAFWPLLGSPNGNGIQRFLTDHKTAT